MTPKPQPQRTKKRVSGSHAGGLTQEPTTFDSQLAIFEGPARAPARGKSRPSTTPLPPASELAEQCAAAAVPPAAHSSAAADTSQSAAESAPPAPLDDGQGPAPRGWDDTVDGRPAVFSDWLGAQVASAQDQAGRDMLLCGVWLLRELKVKVALRIELAQGEVWIATTCRPGAGWARELGVPYLDPGEFEALVAAAEQSRLWPSDAAEWHAKKLRNPGWKISPQTAGVLPDVKRARWSWARLLWALDARLVDVRLYD